jgi:hypothetical protein
MPWCDSDPLAELAGREAPTDIDGQAVPPVQLGYRINSAFLPHMAKFRMQFEDHVFPFGNDP